MGITRIKDSKTQQTGGQKWQNTHKNNEYPKILRSQGATLTTPQITANDRPLTNYLVLHSRTTNAQNTNIRKYIILIHSKYQYSLNLIP